MAYVDYTFYTGTYGGTTISEEAFRKYENKGRLQINRYTFNRVANAVSADPAFVVPEEIRLAQCAIMDFVYSCDMNDGLQVKSETVSSHTVTYTGHKTFEQEIKDIIRTYLGGTPWTYRGGGAGVRPSEDNGI